VVLIGTTDSHGTLLNPQGIDVDALIDLKQSGQSVMDSPDGEKRDREAVVGIDCDIWIPAARPDVVREDNVSQLSTKLVVQGANIPFTDGAEQLCHKRNILVVPDFIANAGGVICASVEYHGGTQSLAFQTIEEKIRSNTRRVLDKVAKTGLLPRQVAVDLARERVQKAMSYRHLISCT
jgi:glutamate dehydrogenase/leucine dehydrogenase